MVYGIGNPLIDIFVEVEDEDLEKLGLYKGTMHLIDEERRHELLRFIDSKQKIYGCGGSCPNTMVALASFGIRSALAGKINQDHFGEIYRNKLHEIGVDSYLKDGTLPTGSSIILISPDSERTMNTFLGACREYGPEDVDDDAIAGADFFHFTGYMWDTENQKAAILYGIEIAKKAGKKVVFDVADPFAVSRNREAFLKLIEEKADLVFANGEEARILFDNYDAYECARSLGKLGVSGVVKNGKQGSFVVCEGEILRIPVKGKEPVDTTGAGDMYAAGFILGLSEKRTLFESGLIASFLAGEIVQRWGAQFPLEEARRLKKLIDTVDAEELP
ncbi:adenosine kinase [Sediminispirochaeta bajacaliforniensis]|uniref:adenosine kinase n=1 Tax=Sediminispirochaeta bajacaliforniensis TaxID=148 RepID=UPI00036BAB48|nr:adenosine kinase [Sediminispirochaeta bajacaliforniensis]